MDSSQAISDALLLAGSLGQLPEPEARPTFIVVSGLPGTGKSYFCQRLAERLPCLVLESDALRKQLFPVPTYSVPESSRLFQTIHQLIDELLSKGIPLVLDATNLSERYRDRLYNIAQRRNAKLILVRMEAPPDVVRERLDSRLTQTDIKGNSDADWTVYQQMKSTVEKIRRNHYAVDTSRDITPVLNKIVREANR